VRRQPNVVEEPSVSSDSMRPTELLGHRLTAYENARGYFLFSASNSSIVRGQSDPSSRDKLRSASTFAPV
jgi:hypothetical protein